MGRQAEPRALKMLHGVRPSRINDAEPVPSAVVVVRPRGLPARARAEWDRLAPDLVRRGVLTFWDAEAFTDYVCLVAIREDAQADLQRNGTTVVALARVLADGTEVFKLQKNPAWQIRREASQLLVGLRARFGLTPSDRSGLRATPSTPDAITGPERLLS